MSTKATVLRSAGAVLITCVLSISSVRAQETTSHERGLDRDKIDQTRVPTTELKHETSEEQDRARKQQFQACLELRIQANERMNAIQKSARLAVLLGVPKPEEDTEAMLATENLQRRLSSKMTILLYLIEDKDYVRKWRKHADAATGNPAAGVTPSIQRTIGADRINLDEQRAVMQAVTAREFDDGGERDLKMFPSAGTDQRLLNSPVERIMDAGLRDCDETPNATVPIAHD